MLVREKILDDIAGLAGGAAGLASGLSQQIRQDIRTRIDEVILRMDFVPRSEFERLEALCQNLRITQEKLEKRLKEFETQNSKKK